MTDNKLTSQLKQEVRLRAKSCCEYCHSQEKFATHSFSVEHIQPLSKGGDSNLDNLALSCQGCNNYKYNKTEGKDPITQSMVSLYHPRQQNWQEHLSWNQDYTLIILYIGCPNPPTRQVDKTQIFIPEPKSQTAPPLNKQK